MRETWAREKQEGGCEVSYGFVSGLADNSDVSYCPKCGEHVYVSHGDGSVTCECGYEFYVIEKEQEEAEK